MDEPIFFMARDFKAKGHERGSKPNTEKIKSMMYEEDYANLESFRPSFSLPIVTNPTLFYPGSGCDILTPLLYIEKLFATTKESTFVFIDTEPFLALIKTILDDVEIPFTNTKEGIIFYWKDQKITLHFQTKDVFSALATLEPFDIYFEKAFRIMKEECMNIEEYEYIILKKLNPKGVLISDSGFQNQQLKYYPIPRELSSYKEMVLGRKN